MLNQKQLLNQRFTAPASRPPTPMPLGNMSGMNMNLSTDHHMMTAGMRQRQTQAATLPQQRTATRGTPFRAYACTLAGLWSPRAGSLSSHLQIRAWT